MDLSQALDFIRPAKNAVMITYRKDGRLQTSIVTVVAGRDGDVWVWSRGRTAKGYNLARDPRMVLCVLQENFRNWLHLEATVHTIVRQPDSLPLLEDYYRLRHGREHESWDQYREEMIRDQRQLFLATPTHAFQPAR
jgi:PPOX class probable F420-dependent enzyme